ncbi:hypothetical protein EAL2_c05550 [Peptoclostridium acidaminophilum DSM 3953]|uniref:Uncharacterized protein n=1 Tax=Peptoclostridium acidaminophilum DSM 3953 TaxID=1286171 RepID=W8TI38_PEPAC|nr:hypothetical protein [Peptoclostridium acidaminophilum]AHM55857.1 hypothetical protein EAL2_c05550 [Peptoclostridium acidaminophilum DSM 3953]
MALIESLMRAVINFYKAHDRNAPVVIERVKEYDSEEMLMDRLERAIFDSCDEKCKSTSSRYAIWGEDIRSLSISAKEAMKSGKLEQAEELMNQVINSMGAFIDAQLILSDLRGKFSFVKSEDIIKSYVTSLQENNEVTDTEKDDFIGRMKEIMNSIK